MSATESFENPLIPHARLRQILLAMLRLRMIEDSLPAKTRAGAHGLEACLVASSIDLNAGDIVSDTLRGPAIDFLRGASLQAALHPGVRSRKRSVLAEAGLASPLAPFASGPHRLWAALGAAAILKLENKRASAGSQGTPRTAVVYLRASEGTRDGLRKALVVAREQVLPVLFVVLGSNARGAEPGSLHALAHRCKVPGITVDSDDAVAIYRVAQESLGRARIGGGPTLIECVPYVLPGSRRVHVHDPIELMKQFVVDRKAAQPGWLDHETRTFARHVL